MVLPWLWTQTLTRGWASVTNQMTHEAKEVRPLSWTVLDLTPKLLCLTITGRAK